MIRFSGWLARYFVLSEEELAALIAHLGVTREPLNRTTEAWTVTPGAEEPFIVVAPLYISRLESKWHLGAPIKGSIPLGLKASYPRMMQKGTEFIQTFPEGRFANTKVYNELQRWLRGHTKPVKGLPSLRIGLSAIIPADVIDYLSL